MTVALLKVADGELVEARNVVAQARRGLAPLNGRSGITQMETEWLDLVERRIDNPHAPVRLPIAPDPDPIVRMIHPPAVDGLSQRISELAGLPKTASTAQAPAGALRRISPQRLAAEPIAVAKASWVDAAFAVRQSGGAHFSQLAAEYGAARSWLYRAPGIPVEHQHRSDSVSMPSAQPVSSAPFLGNVTTALRNRLKTG
jgi:hypothetical protein